MKLYHTGSLEPGYNLACEEWLLRDTGEDAFMLWQNAPVVVIGRNQNAYAEVDLDALARAGATLIRRITGGGAVYHDLGNVNFSYITSREKADALDFAYFTAPVIEALASLGVTAKLSGRNDLLAQLPDGDWAKISGNAATATATRTLHHGTLLFDSDMSVLGSVLRPDDEKLRAKKIASVRSRVTNIRPLLRTDTDTPGFMRELERFMVARLGLEPADLPEDVIRRTDYYRRNIREEYIYGGTDEFSESRRVRTEGGTMVIRFDERDGRIARLRLEGDFFGTFSAEGLEQALLGMTLRPAPVLPEDLDPERYMKGLTRELLAELLARQPE